MSNSTRVVVCADCQRPRRHKCRGLCASCWTRNYRNGTLADFDRIFRPRDEVVGEWELLAARGYTRAQAAPRIGVSRDALDKAIARSTRRVAA